MQNKLLERYADIKEQKKALETEEKLLSQEIMNQMEKEDVDKYDAGFGKFTIVAKTSYEYTESVKKLEEKVKLAKHKEEEQGKAKKVESTYLKFTATK